MTDLYEVLQVHRLADPEVIQAAYRVLARKHHPDMGGLPARMAAINDAWAILGEWTSRATYDAESLASTRRHEHETSTTAAAATSGPPLGRAGQGLSGRRTQDQRGGGTVLDFGRYAGWTVGSLVDHHPDYLEWLARTPLGRSLSIEIDAALARRAAEAAALRPTV
jgi:curved DNA-binding protein CbpA